MLYCLLTLYYIKFNYIIQYNIISYQIILYYIILYYIILKTIDLGTREAAMWASAAAYRGWCKPLE